MRLPFYQTFRAGLLVSLVLMISGCLAAMLSVEDGAGGGTYVNGKLIKEYRSEYPEAVQASMDTLEALQLPVEEQVSGEIITAIKAIRPDDTRIEVDIVKIGKNLTEVSVRTGTKGFWDKNVSGQIQHIIEMNLNRKSAARTAADESILGYHRPSSRSLQPERPPQPEQTPSREIAPKDVASAEKDAADQSIVSARRLSKPSYEPGPSSANRESSTSIDAQQSTRKRKIDIDHDFTIFFADNSNEISAGQVEKLNRIARQILELQNAKVILNGYTDAKGNANYNKLISESRASSIKAYLIGKGVEPANIRIIGHGARDFIAGNNTIEGRNKNRRVEIIISP